MPRRRIIIIASITGLLAIVVLITAVLLRQRQTVGPTPGLADESDFCEITFTVAAPTAVPTVTGTPTVTVSPEPSAVPTAGPTSTSGPTGVPDPTSTPIVPNPSATPRPGPSATSKPQAAVPMPTPVTSLPQSGNFDLTAIILAAGGVFVLAGMVLLLAL